MVKPDEDLYLAALKAMPPLPEDRALDFAILDDPVMARINGQAVAGKGIYAISSEQLHSAIADFPDELSIQTGALLLMPKRDRTPFVDALAEKYPDSPAAQYMMICQAFTSYLDNRIIQKCAARWLKSEPDNFLPVFYNEYALHFKESSESNPKASFTDDAWSTLIEARERLEQDNHATAMISAQEKVLAKVKYPFFHKVDVPSSVKPLLSLLRAIDDDETNDVDLAREKTKVIEKLCHQGVSFFEFTMMDAVLGIASQHHSDKEKDNGEHRKKQKLKHRILLQIASIKDLPVPSLQKAFHDEFKKNPITFYDNMVNLIRENNEIQGKP